MKNVKALLFIMALPGLASGAQDLTLRDALIHAETVSPELKAAEAREAQGKETIRILESIYYPSVNFEANDSWGYPGSNGALGNSGLISSPYRIGPGAELISKLSILDLSKSLAVKTARYQLESLHERTQVIRFQVDEAALQIYLDAARYRGQVEAWRSVSDEISKVDRDVERFVKTGQHSPVERYLVQDQSEEALVGLETSQNKYQAALKRLALFTGLDDNALSCPAAQEMDESAVGVIGPGSASPLVLRAMADAQAAHAGISERSAENYPRLTALASFGDISKSRFIDKQDYSGGIGLVFPLFEGGRVAGEVERAKALAAEKDQNLDQAKFEIDDFNTRFDEAIGNAQIKIRHLDKELDNGHKALNLAMERYLSFLGPLVEVREAIRNLARIEAARSDAHAELLLAEGSKLLLNGGKIRQ